MPVKGLAPSPSAPLSLPEVPLTLRLGELPEPTPSRPGAERTAPPVCSGSTPGEQHPGSHLPRGTPLHRRRQPGCVCTSSGPHPQTLAKPPVPSEHQHQDAGSRLLGGGARRPSPRGPRNLGPAQAVTSGFKPPSQAWPPWAPRTHPDTQDLPATSAHPFQALPRAAPHTLLASHQCHLHCLAPVEALVPPGQPLGGGALPPAPRRARQTDLCTHCCPPGVLLLKDPELTPPAPVGPSPWLLGTG